MSSSDQSRLDQQFNFLRETDKAKFVQRQTYLSDGERKENDAEHSWHLALMAYLFQEYANEPIDIAKTMMMLLTHDLVEIDAGDTYAYDTAGQKTKVERERKAADRLFGMLPEDQKKQLRSLWDEFEKWETPEAQFAHAMDNIQPIMLNAASDGRAWQEHNVKLGQILTRNRKTAKGASRLWKFAYDKFILPHVKSGKIIDDMFVKP